MKLFAYLTFVGFMFVVLLLGVIRAINDLYNFVVVKVAPKVKAANRRLNK